MSHEGRVIQEVWFGVGEAASRIRADENTTLKMVNEYHGTYDADWIVMLRKSDGVEVERHNPLTASSIIWAEEPKP